MLIELPKERYFLANNIPNVNLFPIVASVVYLVQEGKIFVDNIDVPEVIFIIHKSGYSFFHTDSDNIDYSKLYDFFYNEKYITQYFHIYNANHELIDTVHGRKDFNNKLRKRMRMNRVEKLDYTKHIDLDRFIAKSIDEVDPKVFLLFNLKIEIFWGNIDNFMKNGYGWVILDKNYNPMTIWYSMAIANNNSETDIITLPEYRGMGSATIAGALIMKTIHEKNINMDWDVFIDNIPSIKIGERYGYKPYFEYDFLSVFKLL